MTKLVIDLSDVAGGTHPEDTVVVWSPVHREGSAGRTVSPTQHTIRLTEGVGESEVEPGPLMVQTHVRAIADTRPKEVVVPDRASVTLWDLLSKHFHYDPPTITKVARLSEQVEGWTRDAEEAKSGAETSAQTATTAATNASTSEKNAKTSETNAGNSASSASTAAGAANASAGKAKTSETNAAESSSQAQSAKTAAEAAQQKSETASGAAQSARDEAVPAASSTAADRRHVDDVRTLLDQAYAESEAGQALPPRLTESGLGEVFVRQDDRTVHVKTFGAVGDGLADDTAALQAALDSGKPLYWGDASDKYRTTAQLHLNANSPIVWRADGAIIKCDAPAPIRRVFSVELSGHHLTIDGPLTIDADGKAFSCLYAANANDTLVNASISMLEVANPYRSSQDFTGGDGIDLRGGFQTITLDRPIVRNVRMAAGAGIPGRQGVTGITIASLNRTRSPQDISIIDPYIDGVLSEDTTSNADQDGFRIFAAEDVDGVLAPYSTRFHIVGGTIRDCGGRAIKSQAEWGTVTGVHIHRAQSRTRGLVDIDFQVGGGQISNLSVHYEGHAAHKAVNFSGPVTLGKMVPCGSVNGLRVISEATDGPTFLVEFNQRKSPVSQVVLRDFEVVGVQPRWVLGVNGIAGGRHSAILSEVFSSPSTALIRGWTGADQSWTGSILATNCVNHGDAKVPVFLSSSGSLANPKVRTENAVGFNIPATAGDMAVVSTTGTTTSGWNNVEVSAGFGEVWSPSYYRPPVGVYRVTYYRPSSVSFDRMIRGTTAPDDQVTITLTKGFYQEIISFDNTQSIRVVGSMTDLSINFEKLA